MSSRLIFLAMSAALVAVSASVAAAAADVWEGPSTAKKDHVIVLHHRHGYVSSLHDEMSSDEHSALRRLIASIEGPPSEHRRAGIPAEYAVNLMQPFGGVSAGAEAAAHEKQKAEASSLDKAHSGTSAQKKADRGDIFYEKLIIFKTSHDRIKENAESDNKRLSSRDVSQEAERGQKAKQHQIVS